MTTITLDADGPADPAYVLEVARALAEAARVLCHLTRHPEALGEPPDADRLLREISSAAARLPQVLTQVSAHLSQEAAAGRLEVAGGKYRGHPDTAVTDFRACADEASAALMRAAAEIGDAAEITSAMAPAGGGHA